MVLRFAGLTRIFSFFAAKMAMRIFLYFLGGAFALPGAALAFFIWSVSGAAQQKGLLALLYYLFIYCLRLLDWGIWIILAVALLWLALAFVPKYRIIGAVIMALVALTSLIEIFVMTGPPKFDGLFFPALSLTSLFLNIWIIWDNVTSAPISH
jgi:hypothetical protein